jgi:hypothetical protein
MTATRVAMDLISERSCEMNRIGQRMLKLLRPKQIDDLRLNRHIERRYGLVEDQQRGPEHELARLRSAASGRLRTGVGE